MKDADVAKKENKKSKRKKRSETVEETSNNNNNNSNSKSKSASRKPNRRTQSKTRDRETTREATIEASDPPKSAEKDGDPARNAKNLQKEKITMQLVAKQLTLNPWYHGLMPRSDCEEILKSDGDFLVRKTTVAHVDTFCITVHWNGDCRHFPLSFTGKEWKLKGMIKATLTELIDEHMKDKIKIPPSGAILSRVITRPDYYIMHDAVTLGKKLGSGAFGEVFIGTLRRGDEEIDVAVKKLKGQMNKKELNEFMKEAKLMRRFDHPNIVRMHGVAPQEEPIMIVLELAKGGGLKDYLKKNPNMEKEKMIEFCVDACRGMCYLSARQIIHRDLAARNCLLGAAPRYEVKISDFGLSLADTPQIKLEKLNKMPVKWLAPETLSKGVFSKKTDVWSFGVLVWEIMARCQTDPFPGETNKQAMAKILSGKSPLEPPTDSPPIAMAALELCFTQDPEERPEFDAVFRLLCPNEAPPSVSQAEKDTLSR